MPFHLIQADNVSEALHTALNIASAKGQLIQTRNGPAYRIPGVVVTEYTNPMRRVLVNKERDANPFFHLMEAFWIIEGRRDVRFLTLFNKRMADYSDNKSWFHAAYGYRMRRHFKVDQIARAREKLAENKADRQVVLSIWDPNVDNQKSLDIPCNDMLKFWVEDGALNLSVFNRSNDIIWGAYGANVVQFSVLLEYMAASLGLPVGTYYQVSNDLHVYTDTPYLEVWRNQKEADNERGLSYELGTVIATSIFMGDYDRTVYDIKTMFDVFDAGVLAKVNDGHLIGRVATAACEAKSVFFSSVVKPMMLAYHQHKRGDTSLGLRILSVALNQYNERCDWLIAAHDWLSKRKKEVNDGQSHPA